MDAVQQFPQQPKEEDMAAPPSPREGQDAIRKMKINKAAGLDGTRQKMSQSEKHKSRGSPSGGGHGEEVGDEEEQGVMENGTPLMAPALEASLILEKPSTSTDSPLSACPAFQCLDELFTSGRICRNKMASLKASYKLLHDTLRSMQESEIKFLEEAKSCQTKLEELQAEMDKAEEEITSEVPETEVTRLRKQLLQVYNYLKSAEAKGDEMQYELECLQEEKLCLEKELKTLPKAAELDDSWVTDLRNRSEDLKKEVAERQLEIRSLKERRETHIMQIQREQKELEETKKIIEIKQSEIAQNLTIHAPLVKENDRLSHEKASSTSVVPNPGSAHPLGGHLRAQGRLCGPHAVDEVKTDPLSDHTVKDRINKMAGDCQNKLHKKLRNVPVAIQLEEMTTVPDENAAEKTAALDKEISEMKRHLKEADEHNFTLEEERREQVKVMEGRRAKVEAVEKEHRMLLKEKELLKERQTELLGHRAVLDMKLEDTEADNKFLYKKTRAQLKNRDRQMQALKKMKVELQLANEKWAQTQLICNKTQTESDALPQREAFFERRRELQKDIDALRTRLTQQQPALAEEEGRWSEKQELLRKAECVREELHSLHCLTRIKADEMHQKHCDMLRVEKMYNRIKQELKEKDLIINEYKNCNTSLQNRVSRFANVSSVMKKEKDRCVSLKQVALHQIAKMTESLKVLENNNHRLRKSNIKRDRLLALARMKHSHSCQLRDCLRNDVSKVTWKLLEMGQQCEEQKLELVNLTQMIDSQEQAQLERTKSYDTAIQRRNDLGVQLLECEEETCILYDKVNILEALAAKGSMALEALEEETKGLQLDVREEQRQTELTKKTVSDKRKLERQIVTLQIQLSEVKDHNQKMEKALQDPCCENRTRDLKGTDPTHEELVRKIKKLEVCLAEHEEQLIEKCLHLDQMTWLSKIVEERVENGQLDRLMLAKKINESQYCIRDIDEQIMSTTVELSMMQATTWRLKQEMREKEQQVDSCQCRLEQGLSPCPEIEEEWKKVLRDKKRRQRDKAEKERSQLAKEEDSRAKCRPRAYIPEDDGLPLPKPYGALAPFKPLEPGINIRHIRKPKLKPIEQ
ncbi:coiled-coil domain-containing protein 146 [Lampris incognitus]|uniref:coiled-coil domain-containing protein 146 n=1 Tax=Lampris incognitus TaxID=2546036 RepID=UPI0024B5BAB0|nr:coiled-coil domain-containing protein 146 [Lampris incognitus]